MCQTIDKKYFNLCRYCDPTSSSCLSVATCPTDYYLENGICYRCAPGCSACTNYTYCTSCDSGLISRQELNYTLVNQTVNGLLKEVTITSLIR